MSWSCDVCGKGMHEDHSQCYAAQEVSGSIKSLEGKMDELIAILKPIAEKLKEM